MSETEIERLLKAALTLHDEVLLRVAISAGIRREDVVAIRRVGIVVSAGGASAMLTYHEAKKKRDWSVPVGGETLHRLQQHLSSLPKETPWVFPSPRNMKNHLSGRYAYDILNECLVRAALDKRPFHALRATCVKMAQRRGWTIEQTMALTGDTWRTIQEHYATPTKAEMLEVVVAKPLV